MNRRCAWCNREIGVNAITDNLRSHTYPRDMEPLFWWIIPGERCPGTGSTGRDVER